MVSTKLECHRKPRTARAEFESTRNVQSRIRTSPSNITRHSQFISRTFEHSRVHSTEFEHSRTTRIAFDDQGSLPKLIETASQYISKSILGPTTLFESMRLSKHSRTSLEQHSIGFRAFLSYSAAVSLIDNNCTYSPRCPRSYGFISLTEQWQVSQY
jgi:hypothetical protein